MNNVIVAVLSMLGGGGGLALFNYLSKRGEEKADYRMAEFKDNTDVRKEYLKEIENQRSINKEMDLYYKGELAKANTLVEKYREKAYNSELENTKLQAKLDDASNKIGTFKEKVIKQGSDIIESINTNAKSNE